MEKRGKETTKSAFLLYFFSLSLSFTSPHQTVCAVLLLFSFLVLVCFEFLLWQCCEITINSAKEMKEHFQFSFEFVLFFSPPLFIHVYSLDILIIINNKGKFDFIFLVF